MHRWIEEEITGILNILACVEIIILSEALHHDLTNETGGMEPTARVLLCNSRLRKKNPYGCLLDFN